MSIRTWPIALSAFLHLGAAAAFLVHWRDEPKQLKPPPQYVQAKLVKLESSAVKQAQAQPKKVDLTKTITAPKKEPEPKPVDIAAAKKKEQQAREAEQKKREAEKRAEEARKQAEKKRKEEQAREAQRQKMLEDLEKSLQQENLAVSEQILEEEAQSYIELISQRIEQNWSRPPSARNGMNCELLIQLVPTGRVVSVNVVESSGNPAFDRSAELAVQKAESFPEIKDMSPQVFEKYYRRLRLRFNPQDLRQ